ncbi:DUF559 domain-containing protein, partial [Candidatus Halobeggiatoa sp. HSG11]|nr:DUF559 domain-containing protein [Candidatus Halobeggiatoa sp. HSG11]
MQKLQAVHYGEVELIPGIKCDGYVLSDGTACLSERGTAKLLGMKHPTLRNVVANWPPKILKPFVDKALNVVVNSVKVVAKNSHHKGRNITVYDSVFIENLIRSYSLALASHSLKTTQIHVGDRCVTLACSLIRTALEAAIKQACGLNPNIQKIAQKSYTDIVKLLKDFNFPCSIEGDIATKKDIAKFTELPISTINYYLKTHTEAINTIQLDIPTIRQSGSTANRMNGYSLEDVGKMVLGMDSVIGIELKKQVFGTISTLDKLDTKGEIEWQQVLSQVFENLGFQHNYPIGKYRVDFFVKDLNLILECNGYDNHSSYEPIAETKREKFITKNYGLVRFHHLIDWKTLVNGILRTKIGDTT